MKKKTLRCFLPDNTYKTIPLLDTDTAQDAVRVACKKAKFYGDPAFFTLYERAGGKLRRMLLDHELPAEVRALWPDDTHYDFALAEKRPMGTGTETEANLIVHFTDGSSVCMFVKRPTPVSSIVALLTSQLGLTAAANPRLVEIRDGVERELRATERPLDIVASVAVAEPNVNAVLKFLLVTDAPPEDDEGLISVFFVDDTYIDLGILANTTAADVCEALAAELDHGEGSFALFEKKNDFSRRIPDEACPLALAAKWPQQDPDDPRYRFVYEVEEEDATEALDPGRQLAVRHGDKTVRLPLAASDTVQHVIRAMCDARKVVELNRFDLVEVTAANPTGRVCGAGEVVFDKRKALDDAAVAVSYEFRESPAWDPDALGPLEILRVYFPNQTFRSTALRREQTALDLLRMVAFKVWFQIADSVDYYAIYEVIGGVERELGLDERPVAIRESWGERDDARFVFGGRKAAAPPPTEVSNLRDSSFMDESLMMRRASVMVEPGDVLEGLVGGATLVIYFPDDDFVELNVDLEATTGDICAALAEALELPDSSLFTLVVTEDGDAAGVGRPLDDDESPSTVQRTWSPGSRFVFSLRASYDNNEEVEPVVEDEVEPGAGGGAGRGGGGLAVPSRDRNTKGLSLADFDAADIAAFDDNGIIVVETAGGELQWGDNASEFAEWTIDGEDDATIEWPPRRNEDVSDGGAGEDGGQVDSAATPESTPEPPPETAEAESATETVTAGDDDQVQVRVEFAGGDFVELGIYPETRVLDLVDILNAEAGEHASECRLFCLGALLPLSMLKSDELPASYVRLYPRERLRFLFQRPSDVAPLAVRAPRGVAGELRHASLPPGAMRDRPGNRFRSGTDGPDAASRAGNTKRKGPPKKPRRAYRPSEDALAALNREAGSARPPPSPGGVDAIRSGEGTLTKSISAPTLGLGDAPVASRFGSAESLGSTEQDGDSVATTPSPVAADPSRDAPATTASKSPARDPVATPVATVPAALQNAADAEPAVEAAGGSNVSARRTIVKVVLVDGARQKMSVKGDETAESLKRTIGARRNEDPSTFALYVGPPGAEGRLLPDAALVVPAILRSAPNSVVTCRVAKAAKGRPRAPSMLGSSSRPAVGDGAGGASSSGADDGSGVETLESLPVHLRIKHFSNLPVMGSVGKLSRRPTATTSHVAPADAGPSTASMRGPSRGSVRARRDRSSTIVSKRISALNRNRLSSNSTAKRITMTKASLDVLVSKRQATKETVVEIERNLQTLYVRWINGKLGREAVTDFCADLCDGLILIELIETLTGQKIGRVQRNPKSTFRQLDNVALFLAALRRHGVYTKTNIAPEDIVDSFDGNARPLMDVVGSLISRLDPMFTGQ